MGSVRYTLLKVLFSVRKDGFLQMRFSEDITTASCPKVFRAGEDFRFREADSQFLRELVLALVDPDFSYYNGIDEVCIATSKVVKIRYQPALIGRSGVNRKISDVFSARKYHGRKIKVVDNVYELTRRG